MPRTIDLIRESAVSVETMRAAANGALPLPPAETLEILVLLASNPVFKKQARMTLAGWDQQTCCELLSDPATPAPVLEYFLALENRRPALLPVLLENPSVPESKLVPLTQEHSREVVTALLASPRVMDSAQLLRALIPNPVLEPAESERIRQKLDALGVSLEASTDDCQETLERYLREHSEEIAAAEDRPFQLAGDPGDSASSLREDSAPHEPRTLPSPAAAAGTSSERLSIYQKIARLGVGERVQLAMKGNREERFVLIRDGSKVVALAVLESPRLTDQEVETVASMKNVQEAVLRGLAGKRKFVKNYTVVRNLVNNPRCPLDVQLTLVKNLLTNDLRSLSLNKDVSDTVRKLALKMYKERTEKKQAR